MASLVPRPLPDLSCSHGEPIYLEGSEIKSGSGLGTRLATHYVCLHCREMSIVHMRPLKAAGLSFNFGNVIQVVMSVSRCMLQHNV